MQSLARAAPSHAKEARKEDVLGSYPESLYKTWVNICGMEIISPDRFPTSRAGGGLPPRTRMIRSLAPVSLESSQQARRGGGSLWAGGVLAAHCFSLPRESRLR